MKKIYILILLLTQSILHYASSQYEIYQQTGVVAYKPMKEKVWQSAKLHQSINPADSLRIAEKSTVAILHTPSGQIYRSLRSGTYKVYDIIKKAREQSGNTLGLINQQMKLQLNDTSTMPNYGVIGATMRNEAEESFEDTLAQYLLRMSYEMVESGLRPDDGEVDAMLFELREGEYTYILRNHSVVPIYVNIMQINMEQQKIDLLYHDLSLEDPFIWLLPHEERMMDMYSFVPRPWCMYVVFATKQAFDANVLQSNLQYESFIGAKSIPLHGIWCRALVE